MNQHGGERPWSDYRISRLTELWLAGTSCAEIGRQLNCTRNAVIGKARRIGLPRHVDGSIYPERITRLEPAWWAQMRDGGCAYDLGAEVGFSFCGAAVREGSSMCETHHSLCFVPPTRKLAA